MNMNELKNILQQNGIAGAGGAGFPTYAKLDKRADTILLNCAECEPLLKVHRQLLEKYAYEILSTLDMIAKEVEAKEVIISLKGSYKKTLEAVKATIDSMDSYSNITINILPEMYPAGDEVVMIYEATKRVVPPGSIPIEIGVTVFNVETILNAYNAVNKNEPVIYKYLTIAGEVKNPITLKVPIGITVEELVQLAGGATVANPVYISGGPMTGQITGGLDTITKTSNAILVMPPNHIIIQRRQSKIGIDMKRAMASCCQCQMCTDLCPRYMLGHPIEPHAFMRAATSGTTKDLEPFLNTMFCCQCGVCELYACFQGLSPRTLIGAYKDGLKKNGVPVPKGIKAKEIKAKEINPIREHRKIPMKRLTARLGLVPYNVPAPLVDEVVDTALVKIPLSQHIGAPAAAVVKKDDIVTKGQIIGEIPEGKLGVPVHASIDGVVLEANNRFVIIKRK